MDLIYCVQCKASNSPAGFSADLIWTFSSIFFLRAPTVLVSERLVQVVIIPLFAMDFHASQMVIARVFQEQGPIDIDN